MEDNVVVYELLVPGTTITKGHKEINIHFVKNNQVYYGSYDDRSVNNPEQCVSLNRMDRDKFEKILSKEINLGTAVFSRLK